MVKVAKLFFKHEPFHKIVESDVCKCGIEITSIYPRKKRKRQTTSMVFFTNFYFYGFLVYSLTCISFICVSDLIP